MTRLTLILISIIAGMAGFTAGAQRTAKLTEQDRQRYLDEMRDFKHEYLAKELDLTRDQQNAFFPLYDQMEDEVIKVGEETRELEKKVLSNAKATDTEIDSASKAVFEQKAREAEIENAYYPKFRKVLTPRQLLMLKSAEKKFTQQLVRHRGKVQK